MDDLIERIQDYEEKVNRHKEKKARLQGKAESALQHLIDAGFKDDKDAESFIQTEEQRLEAEEQELRSDVEEFDGLYSKYLEGTAD